MAGSPYLQNFSCTGEQDVVEDLIIESIRNYGQDIKYLPRTLVNEDALFGEDPLSQFDTLTSIEAYIKNVEGFEGEGDFLSKFNLEIRDQITFTIAQRRYTEIRTEKILTEQGFPVELDVPNYANTSLLLSEGNAYNLTRSRPYEGDLIYFPLVGKIFEIKFVEHEQIFYTVGRAMTYDLRCELFEYSSERINTGNTEIDAIEDRYSTDMTFVQVLLENGDALLNEDGTSYILQEYRIEDQQATANNEYFGVQGDSILDFSEINPFSEQDRF